MPVTDQDKLDAASVTFEQRLQDIFENGAPGFWTEFTERVPAKSKKIQVDFLGAMPKLRKWVGPKEFQVMRPYEFVATLEKYEKSWEFDRMDVEYDQTGLVNRRINAALADVGRWYDTIATDTLVANPTGYDGVGLYSSSHPHGPSGATQSNTTTSALSFSTFETAMVNFQLLADEQGEPFDMEAITLMTGPKLWPIAMEIIEADAKPVGVDAGNNFRQPGDAAGTNVAATTRYNVWQGKVRYVLNRRLRGTYDDYWYLFGKITGAPPILLYVGRDPQAVRKDRMEDDQRFNNDIYQYSVESDATGVAGAWQATYAGIL